MPTWLILILVVLGIPVLGVVLLNLIAQPDIQARKREARGIIQRQGLSLDDPEVSNLAWHAVFGGSSEMMRARLELLPFWVEFISKKSLTEEEFLKHASEIGNKHGVGAKILEFVELRSGGLKTLR